MKSCSYLLQCMIQGLCLYCGFIIQLQQFYYHDRTNCMAFIHNKQQIMKYHVVPSPSSSSSSSFSKSTSSKATALHSTASRPTVWSVFGDLASTTGSTNLGQGFPDWDTPEFVLDSLKSSISHQYTKSSGYLPLVELLSKRYSLHLNRLIDPLRNIAITVGASQALFLTLTTLLKKDDEIIIFEPFFELYTKQIALTGATPRFVPLGGTVATLDNPWALNIEALRKAITPRTKILLLNSPHNPTGKVFTLEELQSIAEVVRQHPQLIVVSDEVYKYTVYNPLQLGDATSTGHYHFGRLPDMWDRTITISSAGKTFSVTGWQVGWMVGPEKYISPVQTLLPCVQFCTSTPIQEALVKCMLIADSPYEGHDNYYEWLRMQFASKRQILEGGLLAAGIEPMPSQGGFFLMGKLPILREYRDLPSDISAMDEPYDWKYLRHLVRQHSVVGIPASPFFSRSDYDVHYNMPPLARFAFCKRDETLFEAKNRLSTMPKGHVMLNKTLIG